MAARLSMAHVLAGYDGGVIGVKPSKYQAYLRLKRMHRAGNAGIEASIAEAWHLNPSTMKCLGWAGAPLGDVCAAPGK